MEDQQVWSESFFLWKKAEVDAALTVPLNLFSLLQVVSWMLLLLF